MEYSIDSARVKCQCDAEDTVSGGYAVSGMKYCGDCGIRRCFYCSLHTPVSKSCKRCSRGYEADETHCLRCYECPRCFSDLTSQPVLYTEENGILKVVKDKNARVVVKAVFFRCKDKECRYKFTTKIETKPQTLQEIVQGSVQSEECVRFEELNGYYEWCLNYQRILDKRQRIKWKTEILKQFESLEIAKVLNDDNIQALNEKEDDVIKRCSGMGKEVPLARKLECKMRDDCPTCLKETSLLSLFVPIVYVTELGENRLVSFINTSDREMCVVIVDGGFKFTLDPSVDTIKSVPSCLLGYVDGDWKSEIAFRDVDLLSPVEFGIVDKGIGWVTVHTQGKISILVESISIEYY